MRARWLFAAALCLTVALPLDAEVGVVDIESGGPYVLGIIDDPDPTGRIWRRYSPLAASGRIVLNAQGEANGDGDPTVLYHPMTRTPIVAWARNSAAGFDVVLSHVIDGGWSEPLVLAGSTAEELDPYLVLDETTGAVHLLFWIDDGSPRVVHRQAPADLSSWTSPRIVSAPGEIAARPAGTIVDGVLHVVYESHNGGLGGTPKLIVMATDSGSAFTFQTLGSSPHPSPNWPRIHSRSARVWAEWIDDPGAMGWTREGAGGDWDPIAAEPYGSTEELDYFVRGRIRTLASE